MAAKLYQESVAAANRRDVPAVTSLVGSLIASVAWASDGNRKGWARFDSGTELAYYEVEATDATHVTVRAKTKLGDDVETTGNVIAASGTYTTLIPGVSITFGATITTGHKSRVWAASYLLASNAIFVPRGDPGDWQPWIYENADAVDHLLAKTVIGRGTWFENTDGTPLDGFRAIAVNPIADTYAVTIAAGTSSGKKVTSTGSLNTYEADNVALGADNVDLDDSDTTALTFDLYASAANGNDAILYVSDLADCLEMCPDNAGSPDTGNIVTWDASTGVVLPINRPGYSDQLIPAGQTIAFWVRANPPALQTLGRGNARLYPDYQVAE